MTISPWLLICPMVLLLRVGQALYQCGVARSKNAATTLFRAIAEACVGILAFWAFGEAIVSGSWGDLFCLRSGAGGSALFLAIVALISAGAMTGVTIGRARQGVWVAAAILMCGIVTPLCWHLGNSAWLTRLGFVDRAAATYVHFAGGCAATVAALVVGARNGKYNRDGSTNVLLGHSVPLASSGVLLMFVGWIPYIGGCVLLSATSEGVQNTAIFNCVLAGAAGASGAMLYSRLRYGMIDLYLAYTGLLGGLVSITAAADLLSTPMAVLAGAVAGVLVPWAVTRIDLKFKIDDPASAIAIHGVGGLWAAICPALLLGGSIGDHLHRLAAQAVGLGIVAAISIVLPLAVLLALRATVGVHVSEADEFDGLDLAEHDLNAYPDFQQTMIKSYHLREM
jgi:Amt family ammonium transporter